MLRIRLLFTLLILNICGCASKPVTYIDPEAAPYVHEFNLLNQRENPPLIVLFGSWPDAAAKCISYSNGQERIVVDRIFWNELCPAQKRALIFHEMGHCVNKREHVEAVFSYMYPGVFSCEFYENNKQQLDNEMFN